MSLLKSPVRNGQRGQGAEGTSRESRLSEIERAYDLALRHVSS